MLVFQVDDELEQRQRTPPPPASGPLLPQTSNQTQNQNQIDLWDNTNIASAFGMRPDVSPDLYMCQGSPDPQTRLADDVILTNVIGFDVKVWEPAANSGQGGYVDLGYGNVPISARQCCLLRPRTARPPGSITWEPQVRACGDDHNGPRLGQLQLQLRERGDL